MADVLVGSALVIGSLVFGGIVALDKHS